MEMTICFRCSAAIEPGRGERREFVIGRIGRQQRTEMVPLCAGCAIRQDEEVARNQRENEAECARMNAEFQAESRKMDAEFRAESRLHLLLGIPFFLAILAFIGWLLLGR